MKQLKKLTRKELKGISGGANGGLKLEAGLDPGTGGGGWCGAPCDSKCIAPAKCMSCQDGEGNWQSHCQSGL